MTLLDALTGETPFDMLNPGRAPGREFGIFEARSLVACCSG